MACSDPNPTRVLVVDDDPQVREVLREALEHGGFLARVSASAGEGFRGFLEGGFLVVMVDQALPALTGMGLIRLIRLIDQETALLLVSGAADLPTAVSALRIGADDFISKPFKIWDLRDRIATSMSRRAVLRQKNLDLGKEAAGAVEPDPTLDLPGLPGDLTARLGRLIGQVEREVLRLPGLTRRIQAFLAEAATRLPVRGSDAALLDRTAVLQLTGLGAQDPERIRRALAGPREWCEAWRDFAPDGAELLAHLGPQAQACAGLLRSTAALAAGHRSEGRDLFPLEQVLMLGDLWILSEAWGQVRGRGKPTAEAIGALEAAAGFRFKASLASAILKDGV